MHIKDNKPAEAERLGRVAHAAGHTSPDQHPPFLKLIEGGGVGELLDAWFKGWNEANNAEPNVRWISFCRKPTDYRYRGGRRFKRWTKYRPHKTKAAAQRQTDRLRDRGFETKIEKASL